MGPSSFTEAKAESCSPPPYSGSAVDRLLEMHGKRSLQALGNSNTDRFMQQQTAMVWYHPSCERDSHNIFLSSLDRSVFSDSNMHYKVNRLVQWTSNDTELLIHSPCLKNEVTKSLS